MKFYLTDDYTSFESYGFDSNPESDVNNDQFDRKGFAKTLYSIASDTDQPLVIGLDAQWGDGKTSFLKMFEFHYKTQAPIIFFDAFKADAYNDPASAIAGEIYEKAQSILLQGDAVAQEVKDTLSSFLQSTSKIGFQLLLRVLAYKLIGSTDISEFVDGDQEGNLANGVSDDLANSVGVKSYTESKSAIESLNKALTQLSEDMRNQFESDSDKAKPKNLIFIIDELDRCRPDYAVATLEAIKHLFSTTGVVFILSMNKEQLCHSIKGVYGSSIDSSRYLEKFIHISAQLPKPTAYGIDTEPFILRTATKLSIKLNASEVMVLCEHFGAFELSARQVPKLLIYYGIVRNKYPQIADAHLVQQLVIGLCTIHADNPENTKRIYQYCGNRVSSVEEMFGTVIPTNLLSGDYYELWTFVLNRGSSPHLGAGTEARWGAELLKIGGDFALYEDNAQAVVELLLQPLLYLQI